MAYILGALTLLQPKTFRREFIETSANNLLALGSSTKRLENRKERFIFTYQNLTPAEVRSILAEYNLDTVRTFEITDDNFPIASTQVLVDVRNRNYPLTGKAYREDLTLILTEIL